jgi:hypothetical protein
MTPKSCPVNGTVTGKLLIVLLIALVSLIVCETYHFTTLYYITNEDLKGVVLDPINNVHHHQPQLLRHLLHHQLNLRLQRRI